MGGNGGQISLRVSVEAEQAKASLRALGPVGKEAMDTLDRSLKQPSAGLRLIDGGMREVRGGLDDLAARAGPAGRVLASIGPVGLAIAAGLGLASAAAVAFAHALEGAKETAAWGDALAATAGKIGITAEALQKMRYVATQTDVEIGTLESSLQDLNARLGAIQSGVGDAKFKQAFSALGIKPDDLRRIDNATELLPILADRISKLGTTAEQVQIARKLGIEQLLPLLRQGGERVRELEKRFDDLGLGLDNATVAALDRANDQLNEMDQKAQTASNRLHTAFIPALLAVKGVLADLKTAFADFIEGMRAVDDRSTMALRSELANKHADLERGRPQSWGRQRAPYSEKEIQDINNDILRLQGVLAQKVWDNAAKGAPGKPDNPDAGDRLINSTSGPSAQELIDRKESLDLENRTAIARAAHDQAAIDALEREKALTALIAQFRAAGRTQPGEAEALASEQMALRDMAGSAAKSAAADHQAAIDAKIGASAALEKAEAAERTAAAEEKARAAEESARLADKQEREREDRENAVRGGKSKVAESRTDLQKYLDDLPTTFAQAKEAIDNLELHGLQTLEDGLVAVSMGAQSMGQVFHQVLDGMVADLARLVIQRSIIGPLANAIGGIGGGAGLGATIGSVLFGGARAAGGPVTAGMLYQVNERGPEYFRPAVNGWIDPHRSSGAGSSGSGALHLEIHNHGEPARAKVERLQNGGVKLDLYPTVGKKMIERAISEGVVARGRPSLISRG